MNSPHSHHMFFINVPAIIMIAIIMIVIIMILIIMTVIIMIVIIMIAEGDAQTGGRIRVQEKGGGSPCHQKGDGGKSKSGQWVVMKS